MAKYNKSLIGLERPTFPKCKQWQIDQDYIAELKALAQSCFSGAEGAAHACRFLSKFNNEFYGAKVKKGDRSALHNTDVLRKECYHRSDCVRRDIYTKANALGQLEYEAVLLSDQETTIEDLFELDPGAIFDGSNFNRIESFEVVVNSPPVRRYTREELKVFAVSRGMTVSQVGGRHE